ncbi:DUF4262 domain-containing protein [Micromonospora polyrhachis]|uniref:DUF4262 domain-containing protein n=1 Tax=Micromonospora polyrhachis TaxID=1282883 RepID=A0A7W7SM94_9ACTN|nr:DUF4262 domain-containing protein [Micromonospora polyrhachis]MBB4956817.1 hypothetical protein [Micromonospora polyrhachis]
MQTAACPCYICTDTAPGRDEGIVATVREHGWCALRVGGGSAEFAYTVGLWHSFRRSEIVMFGLPGEGMQLWLNACVDLHASGDWPAEGEPFEGVIDGHVTQLRQVDESWREALFGSAHRFYRGWPVPVRQLVWPDRSGLWPWEPQATESSKTRQAFAWLPVDDHPAGGWPLVGEMPDFPFRCGPDADALTTRSILDSRLPIARLVYDEGCYDVLDERGYGADDLCLAYLGDLVKCHPMLGPLATLADGHTAFADGVVAPVSDSERQRSVQAWSTATS